MPQPDNHRLYRLLLRLYPKAHHQEYGDQMVQTLDDMLAGRPSLSEKTEIWARVVFELPASLFEEHIHNIRGMNMTNSKFINKRLFIISGAVGVIVIGILLVVVLTRSNQYTPTTLVNVPHPAVLPGCLTTTDNPKLAVSSNDQTFIANAVATSIIDVPAGTNVDVHIKTFSGSVASGTAVYGGKYGSYNFTAKKTATNASNNYVGGWQISHLVACKV